MTTHNAGTTKQTILGAGGAIGLELAACLREFTSDIRLVNRNPRKVNPTDELFAADLTQKAGVFRAIEGSDIVYVTIGFPYKTSVWKQHWVPFIQHVIEACQLNKAKLVFFDNVYAIGGDHVKHITEASPISPTSKKGAIRAEVNRLILDGIEQKTLDAIIARAPDFFGGASRNNSLLMNLVYNNFVKGKKA